MMSTNPSWDSAFSTTGKIVSGILIVTWTVKEAKGNNVLIFNKSAIRERITSADFQGLVAAQSRALSVLSQEIAESIKRLSENNK